MSNDTATQSPPDVPERTGTAAPPAPKVEGRVLNLFSHGFLILWAAMIILPLAWVLMTALKPSSQINADPLGLPSSLAWDNFARAWEKANIGTFFINTVEVLVGSVTLTMLLGAMAAYVLARYRFLGNRVVFYTFVAGMMFPVFLALFPLYKTIQNAGLSDPIEVAGIKIYVGLILTYAAYSMPFTVFFLTAFFRTLPTGVAEAAMIDGAGHYRLFFQVMLPMAKPGLISITIFNIIGQWNQFLLPLVLVPDPDNNAVISQGLADLAVQMGYKGDPGALFAGTTLAILPVLITYILFQRQIQAGMTAGAIK